ncbi:hypothetical protein [Tuwongella immobilis]|uniref:Uncharacterized protein n=1 Tax=Tuwongella immobilis TaxID=692036 RepID=A0A6C2YJQ6_9BACT|nr:hypothetical protein [Tuwongella immobilis]VIP01810.1 Uncharacterized protein OS=Isosphaera pallida (strain ATCC 43644 / DSM 9630 / IS1B) GN=Isop_0539 PE=4 SV=1 [Tuwongella immobilis]VTR99519.1 Uncharacterized protein OS=Isosphaera pallida (strain ATCC 43644 / DSM 9630 / IS1B) GN=Isop_0539 PE=4 SV=1 [Tuwongella immobilis]
MSVEEIRDRDEAQLFLIQGLWFHRAVAPSAATVRPTLQWALEIIASGQSLSPTGWIGDIGFIALAMDRDGRGAREGVTVPGWTREIAPRYEDYVLGKFYADWTFERAGDALRRYQGEERERDRAKGLAYIVKQFRERAKLSSVELAPGLIRSLLEEKPEDLLARAWESLQTNGPLPRLKAMYEELIAASRAMAEILGLEDILALEQRTALADLGQYVAHRQVVQMVRRLEESLPRQKLKPLAGRQEVPTRVLDEDTYPVGGFSSISNRGSIESLLHSQLAFMENDDGPDLFDIKYVRDELYYYSRDENQFLRRRRTFLFALLPELTQTRFKDPELPCQRGVMMLATLLAAVEKLTEWLGDDALTFEFLLITESDSASPLAHERELLERLLREQIENGTVVIQTLSRDDLAKHCRNRAARSLCHCLVTSTEPYQLHADLTLVEHLRIRSAYPELAMGDDPVMDLEAEDAPDAWGKALEKLLQIWV